MRAQAWLVSAEPKVSLGAHAGDTCQRAADASRNARARATVTSSALATGTSKFKVVVVVKCAMVGVRHATSGGQNSRRRTRDTEAPFKQAGGQASE